MYKARSGARQPAAAAPPVSTLASRRADYEKQYVNLAKYVCSTCPSKGCKLWRTLEFPYSLFCATCALRQERETGVVGADGTLNGDEDIGRLMPAVPSSASTYHMSRVSGNEIAFHWWRTLPSYAPAGGA
jgi:hypothetical protein